MFEITATIKQLAIIGDPVEHSFSPQMHNFLSEQYHAPYVYTAFRVVPEKLEDAIRGMRALGIAGLNVTAPHKFEVVKYLDVVDENAKKFGSVNTVVNRDGVLYGYNTDAYGFYHSLLREGITIRDKDVLIVGAGGATQPVAVLFALEGAKSITILNRTQERAERLASYVESVCGYHVGTKPELSHYDVVINTTSVGMYPHIEDCPISDFSFLDEKSAAADMIYNPEETVFLRCARERGAKTVNGLGMLIEQGLIAYEHFTGIKLSEDCFELVKKEVFGK